MLVKFCVLFVSSSEIFSREENQYIIDVMVIIFMRYDISRALLQPVFLFFLFFSLIGIPIAKSFYFIYLNFTH